MEDYQESNNIIKKYKTDLINRNSLSTKALLASTAIVTPINAIVALMNLSINNPLQAISNIGVSIATGAICVRNIRRQKNNKTELEILNNSDELTKNNTIDLREILNSLKLELANCKADKELYDYMSTGFLISTISTILSSLSTESTPFALSKFILGAGMGYITYICFKEKAYYHKLLHQKEDESQEKKLEMKNNK